MTRKAWLVLLGVVAVMLIALPALAQTDPVPEEGPSTGDIIAAIAIFGGIVKAALAIVKRHLPNLSGTWTQVVGTVFGVGLSAGLDYRAAAALIEQAGLSTVIGRPPAPWFDYVITGFAVMAASGIIAEFVGTAGPKKAALLADSQIVEVNHAGEPL